MPKESRFKSPTFEQQQNIAMKKETTQKDPLQLDYSNWACLYESMRSHGLNQKQIHKNLNKYSQNILTLLSSYQSYQYDKLPIKSMRQKTTQLNHQLRIKLSQVFQFISMLHMEQLEQVVELMFTQFMTMIENVVGCFEGVKEENDRLVREVDEWKLRRKNVICKLCDKDLQHTKLHQLKSQIGSTIASQSPAHQLSTSASTSELTQQLTSQCKNIQQQLHQMSEQHFFNSERDHLIQKINQVLQHRPLITNANSSSSYLQEQSTPDMLLKCLNDMTQLGRGMENDCQIMEVLRKQKRLNSICRGDMSIQDLTDQQKFTSKLKTLFSQPLHRFVLKYQSILMANPSNTNPQQQTPMTLLIDQHTQTSLIKQSQTINQLQKQLMAVNKQLTLLKQSKHKNEKQLYSLYTTMKQNESKLLQTMKENKLVNNNNRILQKQIMQLKKNIKRLQSSHQDEKELIFKAQTQQKATLIKEMSILRQELTLLKEENANRINRVNLSDQQVQTYKIYQLQDKQLVHHSTQTQTHQPSDIFSIQKKNTQKTFRSIKINSKPTRQLDATQTKNNSYALNQIKSPNKKQTKSISSILSDSQIKFSLTATNFINHNQTQNVKKKCSQKQLLQIDQQSQYTDSGSQISLFQSNINNQNRTQKVSNLNTTPLKHHKIPSINSLVPESQQNSTNKLTIKKFMAKMQHKSQPKNNLNSKQKNIVQQSFKQKKALFFQQTAQDKNGQQQKPSSRQTKGNHLVIHNFNDISNFLSSKKQMDQVLVSKLQKISKQQMKSCILTKRAISTSKKSVKKVGINSSLITPNYQSFEESLKVSKLDMKQINRQEIKFHRNERHFAQIKEQDQEQPKSRNTLTARNKNGTKKEHIMKMVERNFEYLMKSGFINLIVDQLKGESNQQRTHEPIKRFSSIDKLRGLN